MRLFLCPHCGKTVHFENNACESCGTAIAFDPGINNMVAVDADNPVCANGAHAACNWISRDGDLCRACRHNETIPYLGDPDNLAQWQTMERAKKRLFYSLVRLRLPLITKAEDPEKGLAFRFLADNGTGETVMTGHATGIITIAIAEADDAERESRRTAMGEPYRTLLGHFRHEIAHYYWDILVAPTAWLDPCRALFGDDRADYGEALKAHYANGAPPDWPNSYVSSYATSHPWEDFAETWAHYFHIADTLETAQSFGIQIDPIRDTTGELSAEVDFSPYRTEDARQLVESWVAVSIMLNELNRSMGLADAYPFVLSDPIEQKIGFIAKLIHAER